MAAAKRVPIEVVEKARAVAALSKQYTLAPGPVAAAPEALKKKPAREKVVAALKRLHPMD